MGRCLLVYDITHDGTRTKVADACLDYGLDRIQYSAFVGELAHTLQEELLLKLKHLVARHGGSIQLYPLCEKDWAGRKVIEEKEKAAKADEGQKKAEEGKGKKGAPGGAAASTKEAVAWGSRRKKGRVSKEKGEMKKAKEENVNELLPIEEAPIERALKGREDGG